MKKSTELEIMPDASLWMKLGRTKYTIPKALAELIDNSIDNKLGDKVNVNIYFQIDGDFIGVLDDGKGMSLETLKNALTIAYHKDDNGKIGEYGFGLKAATSYLGKKLTIYTKMQSDKEYLKFFYDENEFIEKNQWKVNVEYIDELKVKEEVGVSFNNGTYILIEDLNVKLYKRLLIENDKSGILIPKFKRMYRILLKNNELALTINSKGKKDSEFNKKEIIPFEFNQFAAQINFKFLLKNDEKKIEIKGKAGILPFNESNKDIYQYSGFLVSKRGKIIQENGLIGYNFHPEKRLITGEVELPDFETLNNKSDFVRNKDWQVFEKIMKEFIVTPVAAVSNSKYLSKLRQYYQGQDKDESVKSSEEYNINSKLKAYINKIIDKELRVGSEFLNEINPYEIIEKSIDVEEEVFNNYFEQNLKNNIEVYNNRSKKEILISEDKKEKIEAETLDGKLSEIYESISLDSYDTWNYEFKLDEYIIKHEIDRKSNKSQFSYEYNKDKEEIIIKSNINNYDDNLETIKNYIINNITNAICIHKVMVLSVESIDALKEKYYMISQREYILEKVKKNII